MSRWVCPRCERQFGSVNQAHTCLPGISVPELLARHPQWVGDIYYTLLEHLQTLGPVHEDAVNVGVFLKSQRSLVEFRPQVRAVALLLVLPEPVIDSRLTRMSGTGSRVIYRTKVAHPTEIDDQLRGWLSLAYDFATDRE